MDNFLAGRFLVPRSLSRAPGAECQSNKSGQAANKERASMGGRREASAMPYIITEVEHRVVDELRVVHPLLAPKLLRGCHKKH